MPLLGAHQSKNAAGAPRPLHDLERGRDEESAFWWELIEIGEAGEAKFVRAVHAGVARKRRFKSKRLSGVGADAFGTPANDIPVCGKKMHQIGIGPWDVGTVFLYVQECSRV
jgi:hypothetical protein